MPLIAALNLYPSHFKASSIIKVEGYSIGNLALKDPKNLADTVGYPAPHLSNPTNYYDWWVLILKICDENPYLSVATDVLVWENFKKHFESLLTQKFPDVFMLVDSLGTYQISFKTIRIVPMSFMRMLTPVPREMPNPLDLPPLVFFKKGYPNFTCAVLTSTGELLKVAEDFRTPQEAHERRVLEQQKVFNQRLEQLSNFLEHDTVVFLKDFSEDFFAKLGRMRYDIPAVKIREHLENPRKFPVPSLYSYQRILENSFDRAILVKDLMNISQVELGDNHSLPSQFTALIVAEGLKAHKAIPVETLSYYRKSFELARTNRAKLEENYGKIKKAALERSLEEINEIAAEVEAQNELFVAPFGMEARRKLCLKNKAAITYALESVFNYDLATNEAAAEAKAQAKAAVRVTDCTLKI